MEPLTLTLLGYPLSIIANFSYDKLKTIKNGIGDLSAIEQLCVKSFFKAIERHNKDYDDYSSKILKKIAREIKKDKFKFLNCISQNENIFISSFNKKEFHNEVAKKIISVYSIDIDNHPQLISRIVADCFTYYVSSFYNLMNEKEGIQAILVECLKLDKILNLLNKIDQQHTTRYEFEDLRKIVFTNYLNDNLQYKKNVKDYDRYIKNKFKYLELRGFSPKISGKEVQMELEDIFVPLAIGKQQNIVPNILEDSNTQLENTFKSIQILNYNALVILGDPGSGKSTLLKYLATQIVSLRKSDHILKNIIPFFFRLADYSDFYKNEKKSIYEYITNHSDSQYQHIYNENFEYSNMLILMDGLDEITDTPLRLKVTEQVMDLIARYPNNRYIVTSRIVGYQESKLGGTFNHYKLLPLRKEEIQLFSEQWYKSIANHTDKNFKHANQQSKNLFDSISRNPSVLKLASNPLLMTIISMIHYQGKKLPSKRVELYEISTETFLEHWVQLRISDEKQLKDKSEIIEILAPIAFEIHRTKSNALIEESEFKDEFLKYFQEIHTNSSFTEAKQTCNEFIQFLRKQTGFFYEKGVDDDGNSFYGFMHLTFEEYLAAIEFVSKWNEKEIDLKDYVFKPRWTEIIRLAASQIRLSFKGKAGRTQTSNFIKDILSVEDNFEDAYRPLQLATLIISDDVSINDSLQNKIFDDLFGLISKTKDDSLIETIGKLFSELLLSDKQLDLISQIRNIFDCTDENNLLLKNLTAILIENSSFIPIQKIIKENYNKPVVTDQLLKMTPRYGIGKEEFFKKLIKKLIFNYKFPNNDKNKYWIIRSCILRLIEYPRLNNENIVEIFKNSKRDYNYDYILKIIIEIKLSRFYYEKSNSILFKELNEILNHEYLTNLFNNYSHFENNEHYLYNFNFSGFLNLSEDSLNISRNSNEIMYFFWNKDFSRFHNDKIQLKNIGEYLEKIKKVYPFEDYEQIKYYTYYINGPLKNENDLKNFVDANNISSEFLYNFFDWQDFPFYEISKKPEVLSEIIIKNSKRYLYTENENVFKEKINFESFCKLDIPAPVKLLTSIKLARPYDEKLIEDSIDYYNNCDESLREGVFEILFNVLNIINN